MDRFEPHIGLGFLAEFVAVHVERLGRCAADNVLTGEQVDGDDGAHGAGPLSTPQAANSELLSLRNGMVFIGVLAWLGKR
jgi:hypothetical protein